MNAISGEIGLQDFGLGNLIDGTGEQVRVDDDQVSKFARFQRSELLFTAQNLRVVDGVKTDGLFSGESFFGMERAIEVFGAARDRGLHAEEWIVGIDRTE